MDKFDGDRAWSWKRLLAHDESVLDAAWAELMQQHWPATEVPLERRGTVLDVGINSWVRARLNTSKLAVFFNRGRGVCLVCKNFLAYRDAFLYGLGLAWGIDVPNVELLQPQSEAAFELCASLQELERGRGKERTALVATTAAARRNHRAHSQRTAQGTMEGTATRRATRSSGTS